MNKEQIVPEKGDSKQPEADFHGAAIIDENGKEVPITETMVQQACEEEKKKNTQ